MNTRRLLAGTIAVLGLLILGLGGTFLYLLAPFETLSVGTDGLWDSNESGYEVPTDKPFLWKIDRSPPSFLYGTIHVADTRVLQLPRVVKTAFKASDAVYTEVPFDQRSQVRMITQMVVINNRPLEDRLRPHIYKKLTRYVEAQGVEMQLLSRFKIWAVILMLPRLESLKKQRRDLANLNFNQIQNRPPLDQWLYVTARQNDKITGGLEDPEEQTGVFDELSRQEQIQWLNAELDARMQQIQDGTDPMDRLIRLYLRGDGQKLAETSMSLSGIEGRLQRKIRNLVIDRRNGWMARRIADKLHQHPERVHFFAAGTAHFVGKNNIRERLFRDGFAANRVPTTTDAVKDIARLTP